jgi:DNA-directed RNA polymerase specialized sigma24 family protein
MMAKKFKTSKKKRMTYKYFDNKGKVITEIQPTDGETEILINTLHAWDDAEVDAERREDYHVPVHFDGYQSLEGEDATALNPFLADNTYNPSEVMLKALEQEEHKAQDAKIREVLEGLEPKLKDIATKVHIEGRTRVDVAAEYGISETMVRK